MEPCRKKTAMGRKGVHEAACLLPLESMGLADTGFVVSLAWWGWYRRHLLQPPEDFGSPLFIETDTDQLAGVIVG